jgi:hypothetical protein
MLLSHKKAVNRSHTLCYLKDWNVMLWDLLAWLRSEPTEYCPGPGVKGPCILKRDTCVVMRMGGLQKKWKPYRKAIQLRHRLVRKVCRELSGAASCAVLLNKHHWVVGTTKHGGLCVFTSCIMLAQVDTPYAHDLTHTRPVPMFRLCELTCCWEHLLEAQVIAVVATN